MKIFLGLTNIASQFQDFAYGFQQNGCETLTVVDDYLGNNIIEEYFDLNLSSPPKSFGKWIEYFRPKRYRHILHKKYANYRKTIFKKCIKDCDIFFFQWKTFFSDFSDLKILKEAGKKIVVLFVGDDIRWPYAMKQEFAEFGMPQIEYQDSNLRDSDDYLIDRLKYLRNVEKYADLIISSKDVSNLGLRPFSWTNGFIDLRSIESNPNQNRIPKIIHAPSARSFKGTKYILEAISNLQKSNLEFEFNLIENMEYKKILSIYAESDILLGQILCPGGGKQEREALAAGMVVCSCNPQNYFIGRNEAYNTISPIVHTTPDMIETVLRELIPNLTTREKLALSGLDYAKSKLDVVEWCGDIINYLNNPDQKNLYIPKFFREDLIVNDESKLEILNQYTNLVKDCNWYKSYINGGERDGLSF
jgi:hypothetical protein